MIRVRISLIGLDLALTSIAHTPKIMGFVTGATMAETFESDPEGEGDIDLFVNAELDRGERRSCRPVNIDGFRA